jgi:hypothetical protein
MICALEFITLKMYGFFEFKQVNFTYVKPLGGILGKLG